MSQEEALDVTRTYSIAGLLGENPSLITSRPVRTPHHHTSLAGLIGGGSGLARPGEIALANHGVLFLDELPLYARHVLEALRGPVEDGVVRIARSSGSVSFPCRFSLVAAMNPCPCGFTDDPTRICRCSSMQLSGYRGRLSGPLLDRFDLRIEMARVPSDQLFSQEATESSAVIRERVEAARAVQRERYDSEVACNATVSRSILRRHLNLSTTATRMLKDAADEMHLTGRGVDRLQRVSRTIADLAGSGAVLDEHLGFALYLRYVGPDEEVAA
jgi:magnesium chelatase family protein